MENYKPTKKREKNITSPNVFTNTQLWPLSTQGHACCVYISIHSLQPHSVMLKFVSQTISSVNTAICITKRYNSKTGSNNSISIVSNTQSGFKYPLLSPKIFAVSLF